MTLREMQAAIDAWIADNGGYWGELSLLARLSEEVGEVSREYNHRFGEKRKKSTEADSSLEGELADVLDRAVHGQPTRNRPTGRL